jgi:hypothetical protein
MEVRAEDEVANRLTNEKKGTAAFKCASPCRVRSAKR